MEEIPEKKIKREGERGLKRKKRIIFGLILIFLIVVALLLGWLFRKKSFGSITIAPSPQENEKRLEQEKKRYQGEYLSFLYPASYGPKSFDTELKKPLLERLLLSRNDIEGRKIALLVQDIKGYPLEEFSSYRIRALAPDVYVKEKIQKNGLNATLFSKNTSVFEVGAYLVHDQKVASLVLSSPLRLEGLREELLGIVETIEWTEKEGSLTQQGN